MTNGGIFGFGSEQGSAIFDNVGLKFFDEKMFEEKDDFLEKVNSEISAYRGAELEKIFTVLLADIFSVIARELLISDVPNAYVEMRHNLVGDHKEDKRLLSFLNEFHSDIDSEIERYRAGGPSVSPDAPYSFFIVWANASRYGESPRYAVDYTADDEAAAREYFRNLADPPSEDFRLRECYRTGNIQKHFRDYVKKLYNRSKYMVDAIEFCSRCLWINQPLEAFREGGKIVNSEAPGVILRYVAPSGTDLALTGDLTGDFLGTGVDNTVRTISEADRDMAFPLSVAFLEALELHASEEDDAGSDPYLVDSMIEDTEVVEIENRLSSAITVRSGGDNILTVPVKVANSDAHIVRIAARHFRKLVDFRSV